MHALHKKRVSNKKAGRKSPSGPLLIESKAYFLLFSANCASKMIFEGGKSIFFT